MNIEIANRLLQLRKEHKLSQEDLASHLNISRQAVSKWERAEASPDTDNLIELSKLYGITLDELLTGEKMAEPQAAEEQARQDTPGSSANSSAPEEPTPEAQQEPYFENGKDHVSFNRGIHVRSANGDRVDVGFNGIHVEDHSGEKVHVGLDGIHITDNQGNPAAANYRNWHCHNGKEGDKNKMPYKFWYSFPYPLIAVILFFVFGFCGGWAWSWLMFLTIPIYYTTVTAIRKANPHIFCYPILVAVIFFLLGFWGNLWHPGWILFLTIPFYYWLASVLYHGKEHWKDESTDYPNML